MAVQVTLRSQLATNLKALAQAHGWMDSSSMMAVAQSARSEEEALATANELRQAKYSQQQSNMHLVFDDGRLQEKPSLGMALQRYLQGAIGPLPVAADDPIRVQQMLIDKGYGAGPANGIWTPAWQGQMYKWRDHELESQLQGDKTGSVDQNTVERWLKSTLPVAAYDATIGFVKGIPNDLRNLAADALGMAAGALESVGAGKSWMPDPSQFAGDVMRTPEQRQQDAMRRRFETQASVYNAAPWGQDTTPQEAAMRWGRDPAALARDDFTVMGGKNPYWRVTQAALSDVGTAFLLASAARSATKVGSIAAEEWAARRTPEGAARAIQASNRGPGAIAGMFGVKARRAPIWAHPQLEPYLPSSLMTAFDEASAAGIPGAIPGTFGLQSDAAAQAFLNNPMLASTYHLAPTGWKGWYAVRNWAATPYRYAPVRVAGEAANEAMKFGWKARAAATIAGVGPETGSATLSSSIQNEHTIDAINASIARNTGIAAYALDLNNFAMLLHAPLHTIGKTTKTGASLRAAMASADETTNKWFSNMGLPQAWEDFMRGVQKHVKTAYGDDAWSGSYKWEYLVNEVGGEDRARRWVTYKLDDYAVSAKARRMLDTELTRILQEAPSEGAGEATLRIFDQDVLAAKAAEPWSDEEQDALRYFMLRIQRDPELLGEAYHEALSGYRQKDFVNWLLDDYKRNVILGRGRGPVNTVDAGGMANFWNGANAYLDASEVMAREFMPVLRGVQDNAQHMRSGIAGVAMNWSHSELALRENLDTANSVLASGIDDVRNSLEAAYDDATEMVREAQRTHNTELRNAGRGRQARVKQIITDELVPLVDEYKTARQEAFDATRKRRRWEQTVASRPPEEVGISLGPDQQPAFNKAVDDAVNAEKARLRANRQVIGDQAVDDYVAHVANKAVERSQWGAPKLTPEQEELIRRRAIDSITDEEKAQVRQRATRFTKEKRQQIARRIADEWVAKPQDSAHQVVHYTQMEEAAAQARLDEVTAQIQAVMKQYDLKFYPRANTPLGTKAEMAESIRPIIDDAVTQALETQAPSALAPETAQGAMEARWNWRDAAEARDAGVDMSGVPEVTVRDTNAGASYNMATPIAGPPIPELAPAAAQVRSAYDAANAHAMVTRDNERALASLGGWVETVSGETDPMHYGIANKSSLDKVEANERIAEFTGRYDDMVTRQRAAETVMQDADEMFPDFGDAQLDADRAAYIEETLAAAPSADDWAQFEEDWRTFGLEHFGVGPETVRAWASDGWSRVADEFTKRANKLAHPIIFNPAEAPASLMATVDKLDELGYKLVTGRGMGHRFINELPQDALNWERRNRLARLADAIGLNPKIIRNNDIGAVQRANMARRLQSWLDDTPEAWRPGMDAKSLMLLIERLKAGEMPFIGPTWGQKLRAGLRTATSGAKPGEEVWVDAMGGVQRTWAERAGAMSKQFTRTVQHRDIPRKQVVEMLTDARVFEQFFGNGFAPLTKTQANEVYREIVRAYADTPVRMAGAPILDDLFRASATWVGGNWAAAGTVAGAGAGGIGGAAVAATQGDADWADVAKGFAIGTVAGGLAGAGATGAGKLVGANIGEALSWSVANMPNKFKQLTSVGRFELSPMFSLRRVIKANLKLGLEGVAPVWRPMRSVAADMEPVTLASGRTTTSLRRIERAARTGDEAAIRALEQARLRVDKANSLVLRAFPEYDRASFQIIDDADRYLREQDVFSLYNGASYEAYAAYEFDKMGYSTEQIREKLIHSFNYGKGPEVGRTALERTANFVFFPFSFDKTLYRNLGGYLLDRPAQMAFMTNALGAYHWFSNRYPDTPGASEWLDRHMPLLEEVAKLNAFSHGFGFGEVGGINAPMLQLFIPHKWRANDRRSLDVLKRFVPVMKDFQNIWDRSFEQKDIGVAVGQNASLWIQKTFGGKDWLLDTPAHMYKSTETPDVQIKEAYEWRQKLYSEYKDILEYNAKNARNPENQIVFGDQERFGVYARTPITKNALMNIIKDKYPLFDPTGGSKKMIDGADSIDRYLRDESPGGRNNPNYERIAEWVANARKYGRYLQDYDDKDPDTDYAWFRGASKLLYQQASWLSQKDPRFYELYRRYFAYTLGPLEEVR